MTSAVLLLSALLGAWVVDPVQSLDRSQIILLFDRMGEPPFMPKGLANMAFNIPHEWLGDRYKTLGLGLLKRFTGLAKGMIPVRKIELPDFSIPQKLGKDERFSQFLPKHRRIATKLIDIFMSMSTFEDFQSVAVWARSNLNPGLFAYAMHVAMIHREDTKSLALPSEADVFPRKFIEGSVFAKAREESAVVPDPANRVPIMPSKTAGSKEPEHALAYFREDIGLNLHHWHWHLVYPSIGNVNLVKKDRRGELFYYMHEQMLARYDFERLSNGLGRVKPLKFREPILEGYYPKIDSSVASRSVPGRSSNITLSDVHRDDEEIHLELKDLEAWEERLLDVARTHFYVDKSGQIRTLGSEEAIDVLGNMVEASALSLNDEYYGDLHNLGHVALALAHDPDGRHLEAMAAMGDVATACRDPVFYRWHKHVDDIFQEHKRSLAPYSAAELGFNKVKVVAVEVETLGAAQRDVFETFWQQHDVELSRGLDFFARTPVYARTTHLDHKPFTFKIKVQHVGSGQREGYVRIFMAPKFDQSGAPMKFDEQRTLMVELDKFPVSLKRRNNNLEQLSTESSVTIPFERTFRSLEDGRPHGGDKDDQFNFCGCGWPQHMLIPIGNPDGLAAQLFVMITDYSRDKVDQPVVSQCSDAASYCGVHGQKYPDKRPMGFPFDRPASPNVQTINDFLTPNMFVKDVLIKFNDIIEPPPSRNETTPLLPISHLYRPVDGKGLGLLPMGLI